MPDLIVPPLTAPRPVSLGDVLIYLCDPWGYRLAQVVDFESVTIGDALNSVGNLEIVLPYTFDLSLVREGGVVEVWIAPDAGLAPLLECVGFIMRQPVTYTRGGAKFVKIGGPDLDAMLGWRIHTSLTAQSGRADNLIKWYADQNLGAVAGASRSLYNAYGFTVEPDRSYAASVDQESQTRPILDYMSDLTNKAAQTSTGAVKLFWQVVPTQLNPLRVQLRVKRDLWGVDRSLATGSNPVVLYPGRGLSDVVVQADAEGEQTAVYYVYDGGTVGGPVTSNRVNIWPGSRREGVFTYNATAVANTAADAARIELNARKRVYRVQGEVQQVPGRLYGLDYRLGDWMTLAADSDGVTASTVRVDGRTITVQGRAKSVKIKTEYLT